MDVDTGADAALLHAISLHRPVGRHRHFNMVATMRTLEAEAAAVAGHGDGAALWAGATPAVVWERLEGFYDLDGLNEMDDGSDDEEVPRWLRTFAQHCAFLADHEDARKRVVDGVDDEEFLLHPCDTFEALIAPRRIAARGADADEDTDGSTSVAHGVHAPHSDARAPLSDGLSDTETDDGEASGDASESRSARPTQRVLGRRSGVDAYAATRRTSRKRAHTDDAAAEASASPEGAADARQGKRRRGARSAADGEDSPESTAPRTVATRRQRQQEDGRAGTNEGATDEKEDARPSPPPHGTRGARAAPARRVAATPTPDQARHAQSRAASSTSKLGAQAQPSPSPLGRLSRPRRDSARM
ncbi:hypothetical protein MSPP1_002807 [Malassezia sp. CBS 17886]|nr:hypothetical protein MSPP1_002807 [Malassezia sp. CBS 17886]